MEVQLYRRSDLETDRALVEEGKALLQREEVAVVTVAGGLGTRLGLDKPKGCLCVGPDGMLG